MELVAFADPVKERAEEMATQYGGKAYTDYQELLKNEKLDAVSVCTPNYLHAPMSIAVRECRPSCAGGEADGYNG